MFGTRTMFCARIVNCELCFARKLSWREKAFSTRIVLLKEGNSREKEISSSNIQTFVHRSSKSNLFFLLPSFTNSSYFSKIQPTEQMERTHTLAVNDNDGEGKEFSLHWAPDASLCGRMVESYMVDISSPNWVVNKAIQVFGKFPQNTCDENSKANAAVDCAGADGSGSCSACERWPEELADCQEERNSVFPISKMMMRAVNWNIGFTVKTYGVVGGVDEEYLCLKFRKYKAAVDGEHVDSDTCEDNLAVIA